MSKKKLDKIRMTLIYLAWGMAAMLLASLLLLVAGLVGWGI